MQVKITIDGERSLSVALGKISEGISDLRPFWDEVQNKFFQTERQLFESEGRTGASGGWEPLNAGYAEIKRKEFGDVGILVKSGKTFRSLTGETSDSIIEKGKDELALGTRLPYPQFHQQGRGVPERRIFDFTETQRNDMLRALTRQLKQMANKTGLGE